MAVAAIKVERSLIEFAQNFNANLNHIKQWRDQLPQCEPGAFGDTRKADLIPVIDVTTLHAKIGEPALEYDFCPMR